VLYGLESGLRSAWVNEYFGFKRMAIWVGARNSSDGDKAAGTGLSGYRNAAFAAFNTSRLWQISRA